MSIGDKIFVTVMLIMLGITVLWATFKMIKNENTYKQRQKIGAAIYSYHKHMCDIHNYDFEVGYSDMETYDQTERRLKDWGYKNILPPDKFKIIEPYIEK